MQAHQDRRQLYRRDFSFHYLAKQIDHFVEEYFAFVGEAVDRFVWRKHHCTFIFRKFFKSAWPCSVMIDSGWN